MFKSINLPRLGTHTQRVPALSCTDKFLREPYFLHSCALDGRFLYDQVIGECYL